MTRIYTRSSPGRGARRPAGKGRPRISAPRLGFLRRPALYLLLIAAAFGFAVMFAVVLLPLLVKGILALLGVGVALLVPAVAVLVWRWQVLGKAALIRHHWRHLLGGASWFAGLLGVGALFRPATGGLWEVRWAEATLGGLLGQMVLGEPGWWGVARLTALFVAGTGIGVPQSGPWLAAAAARGVVGFWRLRLPQRGAGLVWRQIQEAKAALQDKPPVPPEQADEFVYWVEHMPSTSEPVSALEAPNQAVAASATVLLAEDEPLAPVHQSAWELPALDLFEKLVEAEPADQTQRAKQIEEALASYGVDAKVVQIHVGPAVTQFGIEPGWDRKFKDVKEREITGRVKLDKEGNPVVRTEEVSRTRVKVERITSLSNNLALALSAPSVRIEAPVPGKNVVGIEVPNISPSIVPMRSVIESPAFQRLKARSKVTLALGKGVAGDVVVADLAKMPHLLIAGATGSGKSVCLNAIVNCLLMHATPDEVRLLMVDPKRVELVPYNNVPHLLCPVMVDAEKVVGLLQFVIKEMDERYRKFAAAGVRNIDGYNRSPKVQERLPFWVLVIDELADLMMVAPYEVERSLCRLAQLARATGIHLVVATQRPSVDVVTGLIKANFPTRISFAVTSQIDSRTILDSAGAEKLLGRGDMLYMATDAAKPRRVQGTYVSDADVERIVEYWSSERFQHLRPPTFADEIQSAAAAASGDGVGEDDPLLEKARELADSAERVSTSFLQRRLRVGYPRAARLMETLRDEGYGELEGMDDRF